MIHDHGNTFQRCRLRLPFLHRLAPFFLKRSGARFVGFGVGGIKLNQTCGEGLADARDVLRIELNVRISGRMDVALRTINQLRHFHLVHKSGSVEVTRLSRLDLPIARLRKQQWQPADLKLGAGTHQQVCIACAGNEAWACFDMMHILQCGRRRRHLDLVAAELLRERGPFRFTGKDGQRGRRRQRRCLERQRKCEKEVFSRMAFHVNLRICVRHERRD